MSFSYLHSVRDRVIFGTNSIFNILIILFRVLSSIMRVRRKVSKRTRLLFRLNRNKFFTLTLLLTIRRSRNNNRLRTFREKRINRALTSNNTNNSGILSSSRLLTLFKSVTRRGTTLTIILNLLAIRRRKRIRPVLKRDSNHKRNSKGALMNQTMRRNKFYPRLIGVNLNMRFTRFNSLVTNLSVANISRVKSFTTKLNNRVARLRRANALRGLSGLSLMNFRSGILPARWLWVAGSR